MTRLQPDQPVLGRLRQGLIGEIHVRPFRIAPFLWGFNGVEQRAKRWEVGILQIRMPIVARHRGPDIFTVLLLVRQDLDFGTVGMGAFPLNVNIEIAKPFAEIRLRSDLQILIAKHQHVMFQERIAHQIKSPIVEFIDIDSHHFGAKSIG